MRTIFFTLIATLMLACSDKSNQLPEKQYPPLSHQALKPLILKNTKEFQTAALEKFKEQDYAAYFDLKQDPEKLQQKLNPIIKQLKQQANNAPSLFSYEGRIILGGYDEESQTLKNVTSAFLRGSLSFSNFSVLKPYPQSIYLLLANNEVAHNFTITPDQWQHIRQNLTIDQENRLDAQFIIEIKELQNKRFFQAIIKEIKVLSVQKKLLLHLVDTRPEKEIFANSLLSDGITLNLVPIHNFDYYRHRLLDPILDTSKNRQVCTKSGSQKGHTTLSCRYPLWQGSKQSLLIDVAGGLVTRIRLQSSAQLTADEQQKTIDQATQKLGASRSALKKSINWEHFGVKITFDRQALEQQVKYGQHQTIFDLQPISWLNYIKE